MNMKRRKDRRQGDLIQTKKFIIFERSATILKLIVEELDEEDDGSGDWPLRHDVWYLEEIARGDFTGSGCQEIMRHIGTISTVTYRNCETVVLRRDSQHRKLYKVQTKINKEELFKQLKNDCESLQKQNC